MMNEFEEIINKYCSKYFLLYSSIEETQWGNKEVAKNYLDKYGLKESEYHAVWKPIQDQIFINQNESLPEMVFNDDFKLLAIKGGVLFEKEDFQDLQACLLEIGENSLVIIENTFGRSKETPLRMKFPPNITWEELMSGNFISSVLFEMPHNEYFVFGQTGAWGKYTANDYEKPLDIIGFKSHYSYIFQKYFQQSNEDWNEIHEWLPPKYKN